VVTSSASVLPALLVRPMPGRRSVAAGVWFARGAAHDPASLAGCTHLLEHLTLRRCGDRDRRSLARLVDRLGGDVDAWTSSELMGVSVQTTRDALDDALDLLVDAVAAPTFDPRDVELERRVIQAELELVEDDPAELVEETLLEAAWGRHPLARPVIGTAASLARLKPSIMRRHHANLMRPGRVVASVAGDVEITEVEARLRRLPLGLAPAPPRLPPLRWCAHHRRAGRQLGDQVHARLAFPAVAAADSQAPAFSVLSRLLGVGSSSRLFQRLREEEGLTYDIWSGLVLRHLGGLLEVGWACAGEVFPEVWRLVREELQRLPQTVEPEEVEVAKEGLARGLEMDAESPSGLCSLDVSELLQRGRPFDLDAAVAETMAVTPEGVRDLAERHLRLERMASAICGPENLALQVA